MVQDILKNQKKLLPPEKKESTSVCALCRGTKFLCGKARCPVIVRYHSKVKHKPFLDSVRLEGASPPSVFIGRIGYPKIAVGPMIPPLMGDTSEIDTPERWLNKSIDEIVDFRSQLVPGKILCKRHRCREPFPCSRIHQGISFIKECRVC